MFLQAATRTTLQHTQVTRHNPVTKFQAFNLLAKLPYEYHIRSGMSPSDYGYAMSLPQIRDRIHLHEALQRSHRG